MDSSDPGARLERAVQTARQAELPQGRARMAAARAVQAAAAPHRRVSAWWPTWALTATAAAASLAVLLFVGEPPPATVPAETPAVRPAPPVPALQIGARVAVASGTHGHYLVRAASAEQTDLVITDGVVTARLFHGELPHRLQLHAAELTATAVGTVFSVGFDADGNAFAAVHEGIIEVRQGDETTRVEAGASWPPGASTDALAWEGAVAALQRHRLQPVATANPPLVDRPRPKRAPNATATTRPTPDETGEEGLVARWRRARLLRGQGDDAGALALLEEIDASDDPTWAPLALIERMRIYLARGSEPRQVLQLGSAFLERFEGHRLEREVRSMRCRAAAAAGEALPSDCSSGR